MKGCAWHAWGTHGAHLLVLGSRAGTVIGAADILCALPGVLTLPAPGDPAVNPTRPDPSAIIFPATDAGQASSVKLGSERARGLITAVLASPS